MCTADSPCATELTCDSHALTSSNGGFAGVCVDDSCTKCTEEEPMAVCGIDSADSTNRTYRTSQCYARCVGATKIQDGSCSSMASQNIRCTNALLPRWLQQTRHRPSLPAYGNSRFRKISAINCSNDILPNVKIDIKKCRINLIHFIISALVHKQL